MNKDLRNKLVSDIIELRSLIANSNNMNEITHLNNELKETYDILKTIDNT
jgi:hypothetical protein